MKTANFQYKCRLCGEIFNDSCTSPGNAEIILICTVLGQQMPDKFFGTQPTMVTIHHGCKKGHGVADLIGYIVEEN